MPGERISLSGQHFQMPPRTLKNPDVLVGRRWCRVCLVVGTTSEMTIAASPATPTSVRVFFIVFLPNMRMPLKALPVFSGDTTPYRQCSVPETDGYQAGFFFLNRPTF